MFAPELENNQRVFLREMFQVQWCIWCRYISVVFNLYNLRFCTTRANKVSLLCTVMQAFSDHKDLLKHLYRYFLSNSTQQQYHVSSSNTKHLEHQKKNSPNVNFLAFAPVIRAINIMNAHSYLPNRLSCTGKLKKRMYESSSSIWMPSWKSNPLTAMPSLCLIFCSQFIHFKRQPQVLKPQRKESQW